MTQKGYQVLSSIIEDGYGDLICCVVSARDKGLKKDYYLEISTLCNENKISFFDRLEEPIIECSYQIAISWRWLIKETDNLIVLHDSLLPKYRGFAPLVNSLKNGEKEIGVTALFANKEYDKGDIICCEKVDIEYPIKISCAIELVADCYTRCVNYIVRRIVNKEVLFGTIQNDAQATYSLWLDHEDYKINWNNSSYFIKRFVDAVGYPYAGAYTHLNGKRIRIEDVSVVDDVFIENRTCGKLIFMEDKCPVIVCSEGLLKIETAFYEDGTSALPFKNFRLKFE